MTDQELIELAKKARRNAYVPYSGFAVGAALLTREGKIYLGANIENASYGLTTCAERTAIFKAVSEGEREFVAMAVVADSEELSSPCGACRQVLAEFGDRIRVIMVNLEGKQQEMTSGELLPAAFTVKQLRGQAD
ncbi:MAG: cytidine deaminase [Firmicutes bacterium]|nr:cytidine deaminase [Bacillota bacterium]MCL5038491.1 cytidine deaminase [Bacillota bacterium]